MFNFNIKYFLLILLFLLFGCNLQDNEIDIILCNIENPIIKECFQERGTLKKRDSTLVFDFYYLEIKDFQNDCFNDYQFLRYAKQFKETKTNEFPISGISFCSACPIDKGKENSVNHWNLKQKIIVEFLYKKEDFRLLNEVVYWDEGKHYSIKL